MSFLNKRKGASVAELYVVLAVLAIVSTIVVSFIVVASEKVRTNSDRANAMNDIAVIESIVDDWVEKKMNDGSKFSLFVLNDVMHLKAKNEGLEENISFYNGQLYKGNTPIYDSSVVTEINFTVVDETKKQNGYLIICQVTYEIHKTTTKVLTYEYAFTISNYKYLEAEATQ